MHDTQVWVIPLPEDGQSVSHDTLTCLSEPERRRAERFVQSKDAWRYQAAHAALNVLLAERLHCEPAALPMQTDGHGKPHLTPASPHFNLSHSAAWALVAMHPQWALGVDIEIHRPSRDNESLSRGILSPIEWLAWSSLSPSLRDVAMFNAWTRKEACLKAHGTGLLMPPEQVEVGVSPESTHGCWLPPQGSEVQWVDLRLPVAEPHSASLAWVAP